MRRNVLIAGGSGLIGGRLTRLLLERDYCVSWLSRSAEHKTSFRVYHWDPDKGIIEKGAIEQAHHIINLAGANIMAPWTKDRKHQIIASRVNSTNMLAKALKERPNNVETYLSASAIGYYGDMGEEWVPETTPAAGDFLGICCRLWEDAASRVEEAVQAKGTGQAAAIGTREGPGQLENPAIRTAIIRTGMVLSDKGGALPLLMKPVKAGMGAALGSGRQWVSWIHISDLCRLYIHLLENRGLHGAFNAVSPHPVRNQKLIKEIAAVAGKPLWLPNVPAFALRIALGERSATVLQSTRVSAARIISSDFTFSFPGLPAALNELY